MIEHTPGELSVTAQLDGFFVVPRHKPSGKEVVGNCDLITKACEVPHECSDPQCPGNVNRRRLAAFNGLLAACEAVVKAHAQLVRPYDPRTAIEHVDSLCQLAGKCCAAIIVAKE